MSFRKVAKCPRCLPDAKGAIFNSRSNWNEETESYSRVWECANCHYTMPKKSYKPTQKVTPSQRRIIDTLTGMGWRIKKQEYIGRNIWIECECDNQWYNGNQCYGKITPRGTFNLKTSAFGASDVKITDMSGIRIYLEVKVAK